MTNLKIIWKNQVALFCSTIFLLFIVNVILLVKLYHSSKKSVASNAYGLNNQDVNNAISQDQILATYTIQTDNTSISEVGDMQDSGYQELDARSDVTESSFAPEDGYYFEERDFEMDDPFNILDEIEVDLTRLSQQIEQDLQKRQ